MISQIRIENFQSHENTILDLDPGINVVIGPSDSGKSAIIRALRWLVWNKPGGDSFRSTWGGETSVTVKLTDGAIVRRLRTAKLNEYSLGDSIYHAFGTDPPEDIQKLLNFNEINLQQQLDRPFLLDNSPGQVAQYLNSVAHLDIIDSALSKINGWVREHSVDIKTLEDQKVKLEESLASYSYLPKMEEEVVALEKQEQELLLSQTQRNALSKALSSIYAATGKLASLSRLTALVEPVTRALALYKELQDSEAQKRALSALIAKIQDHTDELQITEHRRSLRPLLEQAQKVYQAQSSSIEQRRVLANLVNQIHSVARAMGKIEQDLKNMRIKFVDGMGENCPLCGGAV